MPGASVRVSEDRDCPASQRLRVHFCVARRKAQRGCALPEEITGSSHGERLRTPPQAAGDMWRWLAKGCAPLLALVMLGPHTRTHLFNWQKGVACCPHPQAVVPVPQTQGPSEVLCHFVLAGGRPALAPSVQHACWWPVGVTSCAGVCSFQWFPVTVTATRISAPPA